MSARVLERRPPHLGPDRGARQLGDAGVAVFGVWALCLFGTQCAFVSDPAGGLVDISG